MMTATVIATVTGTLLGGLADARSGYIPDRVTAATALVVAALAVAGGRAFDAFGGALVAGGMLLALHALTARRGLGLGDVKLGAAIGLGLGPGAAAVALGAAFVGGGAYAAALLASGRARRGDTIPFGPFLAAGTLAVALLPGLTR